jgi:hypothetical protein
MQEPQQPTELTGHNLGRGRRLSPSAMGIGGLAALVALYFSASLLSPWPDLLSDEAASWGPLVWHLEAFKTVVPYSIAILAFVGSVRAVQRWSRS